MKKLIELPYDRERIKKIGELYQNDLQLLRMETFKAMAATYNPKVDEENAKRVSAWCLRTGKRLLVCRFGRAFYTDALLIANARGIKSKEIKAGFAVLKKEFEKISLQLPHLEKIAPEIEKILSFKNEEWFSLAQIEGAINNLKVELRKIEFAFLEEKDEEKNYPAIKNFRGKIDSFRNVIYKFEGEVHRGKKFEPAFVSFLSRIHELDAINIARVNNLQDPFFGENPKVEKLIAESGHNMTISPNPVWLEYAQDWVEALPAYAHYCIIPKQEGYDVAAFTERDILEIIYKISADHWAKNIENVLSRENVGIARRMVVKRHRQKEAGEEKIIAFIKKNNLEREVAGMASLIEKYWEDNFEEISSLQSEGHSREEAILKLYKNAKGEQKNEERINSYLPLALQKKRPLPTVHVLTTLGPTETKVNIAHWLEEAMTLFNIERKCNLEKDVKEKMNFYRKEIGKIALEIIEKEQLKGELFNLVSQQQLKDTEWEKAALMLTNFYPEISLAVNNLAAKRLNLESKNILRDYVGPLAKFTARKEVINEKKLAFLLDKGKYRYQSSGPYKRFHLVYAPSRVDLGPEIIQSVQTIPKWVGGDGEEAANAGGSLYSLFNIAGVTVVNRPQIAEFLKVGENFFTRGGVYYLSLCAGTNINALGVGDFEFFRSEWNKRADRLVLPAGETYGGFCVPKEFSLLLAIITRALDAKTKYEDEEIKNNYLVAYWKNKKMLGSEEINRAGIFDKARLIYLLCKEAKEKNKDIAPLNKIIGVMPAGYKEDVTDVRFSAGARKFEIYCGTFEHLLEDIDPEGREIYKKIFSHYPSPLDIRIVGLCTAKDMFGHVPMDFSPLAAEGYKMLSGHGYDKKWTQKNLEEFGVNLEEWKWKKKEKDLISRLRNKAIFMAFGDNLAQISQQVKNKLLKSGLSEPALQANAQTYGADLSKWKGIEEKIKEKLIKRIGPAIHVLVLEERGIYSKERYAVAMTGCDFLDLGIPDRELLDLIDDLPRVIYLMKKDRENSALIFADGASGARPPLFAYRYPSCKEKVKELFALEENASYGCMGIGKETIEDWKREMSEEREWAQNLLSAILEKRINDAKNIFARICLNIKKRKKLDEAIDLEIKARQKNIWNKYYAQQRKVYSKINEGIPLERFDFSSFLIIGGRWIFNGKLKRKELLRIKEDYEEILKQIPAKEENISHLFKEKYIPPQEKFHQVSTGVFGSLKAVEELHLKLETKEIRKKQYQQALRINRRKNAFRQEIKEDEKGLEKIYQEAISLSSLFFAQKSEEKKEELFGRFLAKNKKAWDLIMEKFSFARCKEDIDAVFGGGEILESEYNHLVRPIGALFEKCKNRKEIEEIAKLAEMLDLTLLMQKVIKIEDGKTAWSDIAKFFDLTVNNHIFDYYPYHYSAERTSAFKNWKREEIFNLAYCHHRSLYRYIRQVIEEKTEFRNKEAGYKNLCLGKFEKDKIAKLALAVEGKTDEEKFWFSYARLRDISTLIYDGYPLPQVSPALEPKSIKHEKRVNIGIIYPIGNTTVTVALEQGPMLARKDNVNLFIIPFPQIQDGRLVARQAFFRDEDKNWKLVQFTSPIVLHACWLHFTHPSRIEIEKTGLPLIQPFLWEAATYLKCEYPKMLAGSGVRLPAQKNWYKKDSEKYGENAKEKIKETLKNFAGIYDVLIIKAEKESGGRRSKILPVRQGNQLMMENIEELTKEIYDISHTDNVVIQEVIRPNVHQLYTKEFLEMVKERFIKELGIGIAADTPLFAYFRLILMKKPSGKYVTTHSITVLSTAAIANVGQGGRLFEYRDEKINAVYRKALREKLEKAARDSLKAQEEYLRKNRKKIIKSYLETHPEFSSIGFKETTNKIGTHDWEILYEMGDYLPVFDKNGLTVVKIEPNPGAGLWRPHNDRLKLVGRDGEGVSLIFQILGEWAKKYKKNM